MLSFGIELSRAFWMARRERRRSTRGRRPPSFAATMIARESFEKSWPRLASAAPFLRLMVAHLLCPDTIPPPLLVPRRTSRRAAPASTSHSCNRGSPVELGVERRDQQVALARGHGVARVRARAPRRRARPRSIHGARMNTASHRAPGPAPAPSSSPRTTPRWRPNALRRTTMSMPADQRLRAPGGRARQHDHARRRCRAPAGPRPAARAARRAARSASATRPSVVLSPPGITMASSPSSSAGRAHLHGLGARRPRSARSCSAKAP